MKGKRRYTLLPIGEIIRENSETSIRLKKKYIRGLKEIDQFSHLRLFWRMDTPSSFTPEPGLFASRSARRSCL